MPLDADGNFDLADFVGDNIPKGWKRHDKPFERIWDMGIVIAAQELKLDLDHAEIDLPHGRIIFAAPTASTADSRGCQGIFLYRLANNAGQCKPPASAD